MTQVAQMLIGFKRQRLERSDEPGLFGLRQDVGPIVESLHDGRALSFIAEQVDLRQAGHDRASSFAAAPVVCRLDRLTPTRRTPRLGG